MAELFKNNASTTLAEALDNSETAVDVTDATLLPTGTGEYRIKVDDEIMIVTSVSSNTLTVTRGAESTTAATHSNGADVLHVLTAGALAAIGGGGGATSITDIGDATGDATIDLAAYTFTIQHNYGNALVIADATGDTSVSIPAAFVSIGNGSIGGVTIAGPATSVYGNTSLGESAGTVMVGSSGSYVGFYGGSTCQQQIVYDGLMDGQIASVSFSSSPTQAECEALRDHCESLRDEIAAIRQALWNVGLLTSV